MEISTSSSRRIETQTGSNLWGYIPTADTTATDDFLLIAQRRRLRVDIYAWPGDGTWRLEGGMSSKSSFNHVF